MALLADDYVPAQHLLKRIFPPGLLMYLAQRQAAVTPRQFPAREQGQVGPYFSLMRRQFGSCSSMR